MKDYGMRMIDTAEAQKDHEQQLIRESESQGRLKSLKNYLGRVVIALAHTKVD